MDYNLTYIPATIDTPHTTEFDTTYMRALFDVGVRMGKAGGEWEHRPPVLVSGVDDLAAGSRNSAAPPPP